ncbi:MAG: hypothetical protein KJ063_00910 [Anaerolineae bacterium]|nr:hypothetical protein [Anaerolineae bacterium]
MSWRIVIYLTLPIMVAVLWPRLFHYFSFKEQVSRLYVITLTIAFSLLCFLFTFTLFTRLLTDSVVENVSFDWPGPRSDPRWDLTNQNNRDAYVQQRGAVTNELWFNLATLPFIESPCYLGKADVCILGYEAKKIYGINFAEAYLLISFISLVMALVGGGLSYYYFVPDVGNSEQLT